MAKESKRSNKITQGMYLQVVSKEWNCPFLNKYGGEAL